MVITADITGNTVIFYRLSLIDWLLNGTSAQIGYSYQETLLNKIWSRFVDKYNCVW